VIFPALLERDDPNPPEFSTDEVLSKFALREATLLAGEILDLDDLFLTVSQP
jgi:hypothetical protein